MICIIIVIYEYTVVKILNSVGKVLKDIRLSLGYTQTEVCKNIMSQSNYSKVEKGEIDISFSNMIEILNRLDMSVDEFMYIKNELKKHINSHMSKINTLRYNDTEKLLEFKQDLEKKQTLTSRELELLAIYDSLILIAVKNDFEAAKEKIKIIWERLEKYDNWYLYDIQLISNIIYLFPTDTAVSIANLAIKQLEKYKGLRGINNLTVNIHMNLLLHLIEHEQYELALDKINKLIPYCISKSLIVHLAVCYIRKGLLLDLLHKNDSDKWYVRGYSLLESIHGDKLKKELQKEVSQYKKRKY